jgi:hypothetical protein
MRNRLIALLAAAAFPILAAAPAPVRPRAGKPEILRISEVKPGMQGVTWTVFAGSEPEAVPVEIIGVWKNAWGPKQDVILAKLGGKVQRTNVAGGMSGSPVYIDGKLAGAVALRLSVFSPDAICGITPIELMLEINDFDETRPSDARTPDRAQPEGPSRSPVLTPIETPLSFAGFHESVLREFGPLFQQLGVVPVQGGATAAMASTKPGLGAANALQPGEAISAVLVSGDMSVSSLGTVTYNDGQRVLAFGHAFFNLGPADMPMAKAEVLTTLSSQFQPNKFANATEIVGALRQDRHSGILGLLGAEARMIPVSVKVRSFADDNTVRKEKDLHFSVFVHQKWTPYLMMFTLFNSISGLNDFADEATYRLSGKVELEGQANLSLATMLAPSEMPVPAPMLLAGWWGDKFNRLYLNAVKTPRLKRVDATIDLLPARRIATIENAWTSATEVDAGSEVPVKVFLRPYRGERIERNLKVKLPAGMPKGEHRILLSDAETLNRMQSAASAVNRFMDLKETVSLLNQERSNNKLYVSLVEARPTVYSDDKTMPSLPASVLNVMQSGRAGNRSFVTSPESAAEQLAIPFDLVVSGSQSLRIIVK